MNITSETVNVVLRTNLTNAIKSLEVNEYEDAGHNIKIALLLIEEAIEGQSETTTPTQQQEPETASAAPTKPESDYQNRQGTTIVI